MASTLRPPLLQWKTLPSESYYGDPTPSAPFFRPNRDDQNQIIFVIGSESGLTSSEKTHLKKLGAKNVRLHTNILRTETASLVVLSQLIS